MNVRWCGCHVSAGNSLGDVSGAVVFCRLHYTAPDLLAALTELREACADAYKAGRIPAEPFVRAGNVIAKATA